MEVSGISFLLFLLQAECVQTSSGTHSCVCQQGWTGNGRDCVEINNCLLPGAGGCHSNATCLYVGPGQVGGCVENKEEVTFSSTPVLDFD